MIKIATVLAVFIVAVALAVSVTCDQAPAIKIGNMLVAGCM